MKFELSYFLTERLNKKMERKNKKNAMTIINIIFITEISFRASRGIVPIKRDGMRKVKINLITPWNAPPWKRAGVRNISNIPS